MKHLGLLLTLLIFYPFYVYGQYKEIACDKYGQIYTLINDSTIIYNTKKGKKLEIKLNQIYFTGGEDELKEYLRNGYYKSGASDDYGYRAFFFMLFNSELKIKEVRSVVLPLSQFTKSRKKRIKQYIKGLKCTKSKWIKKADQKWYAYCFSFVTD